MLEFWNHGFCENGLVGQHDFDAEYYVSSQGEFGRLIDRIKRIDGIINIETSLIVRYVKYSGGLTLP